jgi:hypothetical protein
VERDERLRELEEKYEGYTVYDNAGEKIGKVDDIFVDETDREEYIGVAMGLFGLSGTTLIPVELARINERERAIEVSESKDHVKDAPTFSDDDDITPEYEDRIRRHFGLGSTEPSAERGAYGRYTGAAAGTMPPGGMRDPEMGDRGRIGDEGYREGGGRGELGDRGTFGDRGEPGDRRDPGPSGSLTGAESDRGERMTRGEPGTEGAAERSGAPMTGPGGEMGDRGRTEDEGYREGYREGLREGLREGIGEGGDRDTVDRGEPGDRRDLDPSGTRAGAGPVEEGTTRRGAGEESRERPSGPSEAGQRGEESELTRVWRRIRR